MAMLCLVPVSGVAGTLIVLSDESAAYLVVADELRKGVEGVPPGDSRVDVITAPELARLDAAELRSMDLVVTVGLAAVQAVVAREDVLEVPPPVLGLLIPRQAYERLAPEREGERRRSAVFIDQPLSRQLDLLHVAMPDKTRIGAILGPSSRDLKPELTDLASERGLSLSLASVAQNSDVYAALRIVMPRSDLLLLLPDPVATSVDSVHGLLLTSYRAQVPVIGFSEGLAKAGALLSLYSTAAQQGRQGGEIARRVLAGESGLPAPAHPKYFTVRINGSVARSLGLELPNEQTLTRALLERVVSDSEKARFEGEPRPPGETP